MGIKLRRAHVGYRQIVRHIWKKSPTAMAERRFENRTGGRSRHLLAHEPATVTNLVTVPHAL